MAKRKIIISVPSSNKKGASDNGSNGSMDYGGSNIGLSILGSISAFSIWSALNPSFFTIRKFMDADSEKHIRFGMNAGLVLNIVLGIGLYMSFGKKGLFPSVVTGLTGIGLWGTYDYLIKKNIHQHHEDD